jgi:hypothetical protein
MERKTERFAVAPVAVFVWAGSYNSAMERLTRTEEICIFDEYCYCFEDFHSQKLRWWTMHYSLRLLFPRAHEKEFIMMSK